MLFHRKTTARIMAVLLCLVLVAIAGDQHLAAIALDLRSLQKQGYLQNERLPDSLVLLPPPPADDSTASSLDADMNQQSLTLRNTPRWDLATEDADLSFPHAAETFACAIATPISLANTPHLYTLLRRSLIDAGSSTRKAKRYYQRSRPFMVNDAPTCTPLAEDYLRHNGSYPSGHTTIGWTWALILSEIVPERGDAILTRGKTFGQSRMVCNVHWQSDVLAGFLMGSAVVERLHSDPEFLADMVMAKQEMATARAQGLQPLRDCRAEAKALLVSDRNHR